MICANNHVSVMYSELETPHCPLCRARGRVVATAASAGLACWPHPMRVRSAESNGTWVVSAELTDELGSPYADPTPVQYLIGRGPDEVTARAAFVKSARDYLRVVASLAAKVEALDAETDEELEEQAAEFERAALELERAGAAARLHAADVLGTLRRRRSGD